MFSDVQFDILISLRYFLKNWISITFSLFQSSKIRWKIDLFKIFFMFLVLIFVFVFVINYINYILNMIFW